LYFSVCVVFYYTIIDGKNGQNAAAIIPFLMAAAFIISLIAFFRLQQCATRLLITEDGIVVQKYFQTGNPLFIHSMRSTGLRHLSLHAAKAPLGTNISALIQKKSRS